MLSRSACYRVVSQPIDEIVSTIGSGKDCLLVLCDLSAAFDTVDRDTLLQGLSRRFCVDGSAHVWYKLYVADRRLAS
jgi:hypothetical protein